MGTHDGDVEELARPCGSLLIVTTLPTWAVYAVSFGSPIAAFIGVLIAQLIARRGARELETRSRREETMRNLRWAAELAVRDDDRMSSLGVDQLVALLDSDLLGDLEKGFVEAALATVIADPVEQLDDLDEQGEDVEAVQYLEPDELIEGTPDPAGQPPRIETPPDPRDGGVRSD